MNKSFTSFDVSFDTNDQSYFNEDDLRSAKGISREQAAVLDWLEKFNVSFPFELVPAKFSNGVHLCEIVQKSLKKDLKYYKNPTSLQEKKFNVRKALGFLRTLKDFKSSFVWNEDQISAARPRVVWGILSDLKNFILAKRQPACKSTSVVRSKSGVGFGMQRDNSFIFEENHEQLLKDLVFKVKPWLVYLELDGLLASHSTLSNYVKDNIRNGVVLCSVFKLIEGSLEFCEFPQSPADVYKNIEIAVNGIAGKVHIKRLDLFYYTEPLEVWSLLHTMMMFFPDLQPCKKNSTWPYDHEANLQLQSSILAWVQRLAVSDDLQDFTQLVQLMKSGELLSKIVNKVTGKEVLGILPKPKTPKVALANIEKSFKVLANERKFSQEYIHSPEKVLQGDCKFVMLLLEDLHRYHAGLGIRKRGKSYHTDGPFIVQQTRPALTPQRSYSNITYLTFDQKPSKKAEILETSNQRRLVKNTQSAFEYIEQSTTVPNSSFQGLSSVQKSKKQLFHQVESHSKFAKTREPLKSSDSALPRLNEFLWLGKLGLSLPETLDLGQERIPELSDGLVLCQLLSKLEFKDIQGVQRCRFGTPSAKRNIKLAMGLLRLKPNLSSKALYIDDELASGSGEAFRLVLSEIYKIYKNSVMTLIRFNRKNRNSSFV